MNEIINLIQNKMGLMRKELEKKIEEIPFWQLKTLFSKKDLYSSQEEYKKSILNNYETTNFLYQILEKDLSILRNNEKKELNLFSISPRSLEGKGYSENQIEEFYKFKTIKKTGTIEIFLAPVFICYFSKLSSHSISSKKSSTFIICCKYLKSIIFSDFL